jgi:hypothetical protein
MLALVGGCGGGDDPELTQTTFIDSPGKVVYHGDRGECRQKNGMVTCAFFGENGKRRGLCRVPEAEAKPVIKRRRCP